MAAIAETYAPQESRAAGILWMLATMFCFISLDAIMKHLLERYSLIEVTWGRFFFATIVAIAICGRRLPALAMSRTPALQGFRSLLLMLTTGLFNAGIRTIPLATATTIMFTSPAWSRSCRSLSSARRWVCGAGQVLRWALQAQ